MLVDEEDQPSLSDRLAVIALLVALAGLPLAIIAIGWVGGGSLGVQTGSPYHWVFDLSLLLLIAGYVVLTQLHEQIFLFTSVRISDPELEAMSAPAELRISYLPQPANRWLRAGLLDRPWRRAVLINAIDYERLPRDEIKALIAKVATGASLTLGESAHAFDRMMSGEATPSQMAALLPDPFDSGARPLHHGAGHSDRRAVFPQCADSAHVTSRAVHDRGVELDDTVEVRVAAVPNGVVAGVVLLPYLSGRIAERDAYMGAADAVGAAPVLRLLRVDGAPQPQWVREMTAELAKRADAEARLRTEGETR